MRRSCNTWRTAFPARTSRPPSGMGRARLQQWLCFIGTELHKGLFMPLLDPKAPEAGKTYTQNKGASCLAYLDRYLAGCDYLLDRFSVADAYLFTVLNVGRCASVAGGAGRRSVTGHAECWRLVS